MAEFSQGLAIAFGVWIVIICVVVIQATMILLKIIGVSTLSWLLTFMPFLAVIILWVIVAIVAGLAYLYLTL